MAVMHLAKAASATYVILGGSELAPACLHVTIAASNGVVRDTAVDARPDDAARSPKLGSSAIRTIAKNHNRMSFCT